MMMSSISVAALDSRCVYKRSHLWSNQKNIQNRYVYQELKCASLTSNRRQKQSMRRRFPSWPQSTQKWSLCQRICPRMNSAGWSWTWESTRDLIDQSKTAPFAAKSSNLSMRIRSTYGSTSRFARTAIWNWSHGQTIRSISRFVAGSTMWKHCQETTPVKLWRYQSSSSSVNCANGAMQMRNSFEVTKSIDARNDIFKTVGSSRSKEITICFNSTLL